MAQHASIIAYLVNNIFRYCFCVTMDNLRDAVGAHVADILKEQREKQKLSLGGLARKAGLARQTIAFVEHKVQSPSLDTLLRITAAMGLDLEKIIARARKRALRLGKDKL